MHRTAKLLIRATSVVYLWMVHTMRENTAAVPPPSGLLTIQNETIANTKCSVTITCNNQYQYFDQ